MRHKEIRERERERERKKDESSENGNELKDKCGNVASDGEGEGAEFSEFARSYPEGILQDDCVCLVSNSKLWQKLDSRILKNLEES